MSVNIPDYIPAFTAMTFNLNGAVTDPARKLRWVHDTFVRTGKADIILFQELHFGSLTHLRKAFWPYRGELKGLSMNPNANTRGVVAWIPGDSSLTGLVETVTTDTVEGRWALMRINSKNEHIHLLNIYAPSKSVAHRELFYGDMKVRFNDYSNLIIAGDFNFVSRAIDFLGVNGPREPTPHPIAEEWLDELEVIDTFAHELPDAVVSTFRHRDENLMCWKRLDRFYAHYSMLEKISHVDSLSCPDISDHDPVMIHYGETELPQQGAKVLYSMSRSLIKQLGIPDSKVRLYTEKVLKGCAEFDSVDPNTNWDTCKWALIKYFQQCDKQNAQRARDKKNRAFKLAKWGDQQDLPDSLAKFKSAFEVRQEGERLLN